MMTPDVIAVVLIAVWLVLYLVVIGPKPRAGEVVSPRRLARPQYRVAEEPATDDEKKEKAISRWDNEGGAPPRDRKRLSPALVRFAH